MSLTGCEGDLLRALTETPLLDRLDMAALSGWSRSAVYEAAERLESSGLAASIPHAADLTPPTRRYLLTAGGLRRLAEDEGIPVEDLLRTRPVSAQWLRILMERLDGLAVIYRLASTISNIAYPLRLRLYRAKPLDAALTIPDGRTVGIVRQGLTADRTAFSKRLWRLAEVPLPGLVLMLAPDEVRLRHSRRLLARTPVNALLALERDAALVGPEDEVWVPLKVNANLDLRSELKRLSPGGRLPPEQPLARATLPGDLVAYSPRATSALLRPAEKRALDLLADWPWMLRRDAASLMDLSESRFSRIITPLEGFGLVTRPVVGSCRLALTDRGLAMLARRDRASVALARKRWSVSPVDGDAPYDWRNVSGGRSRQLLRNIDHTGAVHFFAAALANQARTLGWGLAQLDPPHRASRHFRHEGSLRSVHPDAFGVLRRGPVTWPFFLEYERRAVRPSTMAARLAPYLRYYSSHKPIDDHGVRPSVLIVFDDDLAATHFLSVAHRGMRQKNVTAPLWVSHRAAIDALGPMGRAWQTPGDPEPAHLPLGR